MSQSNYTVNGRVVTRNEHPRFRMIFTPNTDGSWDGGHVEWIDTPPTDVMLIARLMSEAGDSVRKAIDNGEVE
jgi:hypothetical protein